MRTINCTITTIAAAANAGLQTIARTILATRSFVSVSVPVSRGVFGSVGRGYARLLPALQPVRLGDADNCQHRHERQAGGLGKWATKMWSLAMATSPGLVSLG